MTEIVFLIEDDPDGGYTARALGAAIFTEADDVATLREEVRNAVRCHFADEQSRPKPIRGIVNSVVLVDPNAHPEINFRANSRSPFQWTEILI